LAVSFPMQIIYRIVSSYRACHIIYWQLLIAVCIVISMFI